MSESGEISLVLANSGNIFQKEEHRDILKKFSDFIKESNIKLTLLTTNNTNSIKNIIENKPDIVLVFQNYKNIEQLKENFGFVRKIKKKLPDSKIAFFSGDSTPNGFKVGLLKRGVDVWIPYKQVNNVPEILNKIYKGENLRFEGVLTKEIINK